METITLAEFAGALGLDPKAPKEVVIKALAELLAARREQSARIEILEEELERFASAPRQASGGRPKRLSKKYESVREFEKLSRDEVRVRVVTSHPIAERGGVYYPAERNKDGRITKPGDVFITDRARLKKIATMVEEVPKDTLTTAEAKAKEAQKAA
jgi:hypothetical protein